MLVVGLLSMFPALAVWTWKKSFLLGVVTWFFCMFQAFMMFGLATAIPVNMVVFPELFVGFVIFWTWWIFGRKPNSYQAAPKIPYVKAPVNPDAPVYFPAAKGYQAQQYFGPRFQSQADADAWIAANPPQRIKK